jgi:DNA ligase (NAD+)
MQAHKFLEKLKLLKKENLLELDGIGEVLANNIEIYTNSKEFQDLESKLKNVDLEINSSQVKLTLAEQAQQTLKNEIICITGSFDIPRDQIQTLLEQKGAKCVSSITNSTTLLIAGEKAGSKIEKATQKGIKITDNYKQFI